MGGGVRNAGLRELLPSPVVQVPLRELYAPGLPLLGCARAASPGYILLGGPYEAF
jgi:hypothetical protein